VRGVPTFSFDNKKEREKKRLKRKKKTGKKFFLRPLSLFSLSVVKSLL